MSVTDEYKIDSIYIKSEFIVELRIYDIYCWKNDFNHFTALSDKLNTYTIYIECGELLEHVPDAKCKTPKILIMFAYEPSEEIIDFLDNQVSEHLSDMNIQFEYVYNDDLLFSSHFDFLQDHEISRIGDSGPLYLANHKCKKDEKYLVKHKYPDCACNEYIYSKLANLLDLKVAPAKLFILSDANDKNVFNTKYVVGLTWLDIVDTKIHKDKLENLYTINKDDYYRFIALSALLYDEDSFEIVLDKNGYIYKVDNTAAFSIDNYNIPPNILPYSIEFRTPEAYLGRLSEDHLTDRYSNFINNHGSDKASFFIDTVARFSKLGNDCIDNELEILSHLYSDELVNYYRIYVKWMKEQATIFLQSLKNKASH